MMMHNTTNDDSVWEVRPGGMLVQRREHSASSSDQPLHDPHSASAVFSQTIRITVSHGSSLHHLYISTLATFGDLKKALVQKTGLEASELKILFRGVERDDAEQLQAAGVKDASKVVLLDDPNLKMRVEPIEQPPVITEEMSKSIAAVLEVTWEVDKLSDRVVALEVAVNGGTKVAVEEFDMTAELLMRQLLKLDGVDAEGEPRVQRRAEVHRLQKLQEIVDTLKVRCSNPFVDQSKAAAVSTEWESFRNIVGSLSPPPPASPSVNLSDRVITEEMSKAMAAVFEVTWEVDKLSDRVVALEVAVNGGTKVAVEEFDMTAELLMRQLLKLDGIEAEGEARVQRRTEVRKVQKLQEMVDTLKARCSNPFVD